MRIPFIGLYREGYIMKEDCISLAVEDFYSLGLKKPLLKALEQAGYSEPTPIQAKMVPHVLANRDVVGQAQTGTGKTAAFALPLLHNLQPTKKARPQILVLTPTRELALQVAESFKEYGKYLDYLKVLAIYGGEEYNGQLNQLKRGVNVVVGTPGRVMDHIRRGSLDLSTIQSFVLDEADEMLKMGFIDDVEWILDQAPEYKQTALFSATMPESIRRIAATYLNDPMEVTILSKTVTASTVNQSYLLTRGYSDKKQALTKILEVADADGVLVFVRTKMQTVEIAELLMESGHTAAALNGDIPQAQRLRTVDQLKSGKIDILVATDVAARGLDVERISHVINYDIPFDTESYIHRIGRTGRAGRQGQAILFLTPREKGMLKSIERVTRQKIAMTHLPTVDEINMRRVDLYKQRITAAMSSDCLLFRQLINEYADETGAPLAEIAAALAKLAQGDQPLLLEKEKEVPKKQNREAKRKAERNSTARITRAKPPENGMERYHISLGEEHGVKPGNIVGAIANEADIDSEYIGRINIYGGHSTVDLPLGMPRQLRKVLYNARINGKMMRLCKEGSETSFGIESNSRRKPARKGRGGKHPRKGKGGNAGKRSGAIH